MITIGLPLFNQSDSLPYCIQSINNQVNTGDFELIVITETASIQDFKNLNHPNLVKFTFIKLDYWMPLPHKWKRIGELMHPESVGMILQAGDCYAHPNRIQLSRKAMREYDWYHERNGYFYDIASKRMSVYKGTGMTHINMCIKAKHVRTLPFSDLKKNIDRWMYDTIDNPKVCTNQELFNGVDFHGDNNISKKRGARITKFIPPFYYTDKTLDEIIHG